MLLWDKGTRGIGKPTGVAQLSESGTTGEAWIIRQERNHAGGLESQEL